MIDLRSDTVTRPTAGMRRAMADAEVGDDVLDGDPTVRALQDAVAERLGKPAALFFPTGTMANQAGCAVLGRHGTEAYLHEGAHLVDWEMAGLAALAGIQPRLVRGAPVLTAATLEAAFRAPSPHAPRASLVCVENTHNGAGGAVTPLPELQAIRAVAAARHLPVHLDGARLWNASVATGTPLADFAACADTVMVSFAKGLGAPVGAALAGSVEAMAEAHLVRKRYGGGMRQSGVLAAACRYGLQHHYDGLGTDHARATRFATQVADACPTARVVMPDTNIVMIDLPPGRTSAEVVAACRAAGVLLSPWHATRVRAVTHLDVDDAAVARAGVVVAEVLRAA